jgi:sugar lactone lactonase YvrE
VLGHEENWLAYFRPGRYESVLKGCLYGPSFWMQRLGTQVEQTFGQEFVRPPSATLKEKIMMNAQQVGSNFNFLSTVFARWLLGLFLVLSRAAADGQDPLITISRDANGVEIKFVGVLQSADGVTGPWLDESGGTPVRITPSSAARYYRVKPFELPAAAHFSVNLETGEVAIAPEPTLSRQGLHAAAVFAGSTIGFNSSVVLDEGGNPGRKVLSVSLVNQTREIVGEQPDGYLAGIKVIFGEFKNLSTPSDLRLQTTVSTLAGSGVVGSTDGEALSATFIRPSGVVTGPDGSIYICDGSANKIRKLKGHQVFTLAGSGTAASVDGIGSAASINKPWGIAYSPSLNGVVIAERNGLRIRLLTLDGRMTIVAGTGAFGGADGTGNAATFNEPIAVAVDGSGAIYVAELAGLRIRKITLTGADPRTASSYTVSTWAGSGVAGSVDGTGTAAQFKAIYGLAAEPDGTLYVGDAGNSKVRRISPRREVVTIAGTGVAGSVDGKGTVAQFKGPAGIALLNGSIAISDYSDNKVRLLTLTPGGTVQNPADWQVRTLAGTGTAGATDGRGDGAQFNNPFSLTADGTGNLVVADYANMKLRKVTPTAGFFPVGIPTPTTVTEPVRLSNAEGVYNFTTAGGPTSRPFITYDESLLPGATSAAQKWAFKVPAGVNGFEFSVTVIAPTDTQVPLASVSNAGNGSPDVLVSTFAGTGATGYVNGQASSARFFNAYGIAVDRDGNLYVADTSNQAIRRIGKDRIVTTIAGGLNRTPGFVDGRGDLARFYSPYGVAAAADGRTLYVADYNNNAIRRIVSNGGDPKLPGTWSVGTIAGAPGAATYVDNIDGASARFYSPFGIAWAPGDTLYVTEASGNRVRMLQPQGDNLQVASSWFVSLVAGDSSAVTGASGTTDGLWYNARFYIPRGIAVDQAGYVYVADEGNNRIRKIDPNGTVSTLAGSSYGYADGNGTSALFSQPRGITVDSTGYVYVADTFSHRIRQVSPAGTVTTVAGTGFIGSLDGTADGATLYYPVALAIDESGILYATSDLQLDTIRMIQRILK